MDILLPTSLSHIRLDEKGMAWIDDTNVKVIEVVMGKLAHGSSPEEIHFQHPHLSLSQIHAALTYYYDHQKNLDDLIEHGYQRVQEMKSQAEETPFRKRLRETGK